MLPPASGNDDEKRQDARISGNAGSKPFANFVIQTFAQRKLRIAVPLDSENIMVYLCPLKT